MSSGDNKIVVLDQLSPDGTPDSRFHIYTPAHLSQMSITELNDYLCRFKSWTRQFESAISSEIRTQARRENPHYDEIPF